MTYDSFSHPTTYSIPLLLPPPPALVKDKVKTLGHAAAEELRGPFMTKQEAASSSTYGKDASGRPDGEEVRGRPCCWAA